MPGTKASGKAAAATHKRKYGPDYHARIGQLGGLVKNPKKGFGGLTPEQRTVAALKGHETRRRKREQSKELS